MSTLDFTDLRFFNPAYTTQYTWGQRAIGDALTPMSTYYDNLSYNRWNNRITRMKAALLVEYITNFYKEHDPIATANSNASSIDTSWTTLEKKYSVELVTPFRTAYESDPRLLQELANLPSKPLALDEAIEQGSIAHHDAIEGTRRIYEATLTDRSKSDYDSALSNKIKFDKSVEFIQEKIRVAARAL